MTSVGEKLRQERLKQGIDLKNLARDLRINLKYLEAIESNDRDSLPGGFFYRSFVRQYSLALGLDPDQFENELAQVREAEAPVLDALLTHAEFPLKPPDPIVIESNRRYLPGGRIWVSVALLGAVLAGCSAFYQWWNRNQTAPQTVAESVAPAPQRSAPSASPAGASQPIATQPVATSNPQTVAPDLTIPADAKVVLSFSATEETWVSIYSDGKRIFSGVLQPSQIKTLGGKDQFRIRVGNAGGLEITWNGKQIPPVGEKGQVKDLLFTQDRYQIMSPNGSL